MATFRDEIHTDINNTYISDCAHGILLTSSTCALTNSSIQGNAGYPIIFQDLKMTLDYKDSETLNFFIEDFSDNTFSNNGQNFFAIGGNVVVVEGDEIPGPLTMDLEWKKLTIPYLVTAPLKFFGLNICL